MRNLSLFLFLITFCGFVFAKDELNPELENNKINYKLSSLDKIQINVFGIDDLSTEQRIDQTGAIRVALLGRIEVAGMTVSQAENFIAELYIIERYIKAPQVTITITDYAPNEVSVIGQVKSPGQVSFPIETQQMSILDVIARAGDFTDVAKRDDVLVKRQVNGVEQRFKVDVERYLKDKNVKLEEIFLIQAGDVIYVPASIF